MTDTNPLSSTSFLDTLLEVLKDQPAEIRDLFLTTSEEDLRKAYNEGVEAARRKHPNSANPYPMDEEQAFSPWVAWNEGWMNGQLNLSELLND